MTVMFSRGPRTPGRLSLVSTVPMLVVQSCDFPARPADPADPAAAFAPPVEAVARNRSLAKTRVTLDWSAGSRPLRVATSLAWPMWGTAHSATAASDSRAAEKEKVGCISSKLDMVKKRVRHQRRTPVGPLRIRLTCPKSCPNSFLLWCPCQQRYWPQRRWSG